MDKYLKLKRFHPDLQLQVYRYYFMYVDLKKIPVEDHFPDFFWRTTRKFQLQDQSQNIVFDLVTHV